jgi:MoxR-like ATPase
LIDQQHRALFASHDVLRFFVDAIMAAHFFSPGTWIITSPPRALVLSVSGHRCVSVFPAALRVLASRKLLPASVQETAKPIIESSDLVEATVQVSQLSAIAESLRGAASSAIEWATKNTRSTGGRREHDASVIEYLRRELRIWLPQPTDGTERTDEQDELPFSARCFELLSELSSANSVAAYEQRKHQLRQFVHAPLRTLARRVVASLPRPLTIGLETRHRVFSRFLSEDGTELETAEHWVSFGPKGRAKECEPLLFVILLPYQLQFGLDARSLSPARQEQFSKTLIEWFDREPNNVIERLDGLSFGLTPSLFSTAAEWIKSGGVQDLLLVYNQIPAEDVIGTSVGDLADVVTVTLDAVYPLFEIAADIEDFEEIDLLVDGNVTNVGTDAADPAARAIVTATNHPVYAGPYTRDDALRDVLIEPTTFDSMITTLRRKKNIVLEGPPGVGKTFIGTRLARTLIGHGGMRNMSIVQFHQSYSYEDFVQGFRPIKTGGFELRSGPFLSLARDAVRAPHQRFVLLIDEINRGNLSRILGELLMLIEHDKRTPQHAVTLAYSHVGDTFFVPDNLYVIGMMNTADRSLAMVDYALRRRFSFFRIRPAFNDRFRELLLSNGATDEFVNELTTRVTRLNDRIRDDRNLGPGFEIGHSYFCPADGENCDGAWLQQVVETEVRPMLREYWFDALADADAAAEELLVP